MEAPLDAGHHRLGSGERQTACQILVAGSKKDLAHNNGGLWDSGRIEGDDSDGATL